MMIKNGSRKEKKKNIVKNIEENKSLGKEVKEKQMRNKKNDSNGKRVKQ